MRPQRSSRAVTPFLNAKAELIRGDDDDALFPLELMHEDLHLAALTAYENNQPLTVRQSGQGDLCRSQKKRLRQAGLRRDLQISQPLIADARVLNG